MQSNQISLDLDSGVYKTTKGAHVPAISYLTNSIATAISPLFKLDYPDEQRFNQFQACHALRMAYRDGPYLAKPKDEWIEPYLKTYQTFVNRNPNLTYCCRTVWCDAPKYISHFAGILDISLSDGEIMVVNMGTDIALGKHVEAEALRRGLGWMTGRKVTKTYVLCIDAVGWSVRDIDTDPDDNWALFLSKLEEFSPNGQ